MKYFSFFALLLSLVIFNSVGVKAQNLKLEELSKTFSSADYPNSVFNMLEAKGFNRLDKQYPDFCERVIYFYQSGGKPSIFINPQVCNKPVDQELYPVKVKNEMQLQFQRSSRASFENLSALIRKQCKPLPPAPAADGEENSGVQAYKHPVNGTIFLIKPTAKICYIYLLR